MFLKIIILFIFIGALQGVIFCLHILFKKNYNRQAVLFLSLLLFSISLDLLETGLDLSGVTLWHTKYIPFAITFAIGPSLYWYTKTILKNFKPPTKRILFSYLPLFIYFTINFILFYYPVLFEVKIKMKWVVLYHFFSRVIAIALIWFYLYCSFRNLKLFKANLNIKDISETVICKWIYRLLNSSFLSVLASSIIIVIIILFNPKESVVYSYLMPIELLLCYLILWISFRGYNNITLAYSHKENENQFFIETEKAIQIEKELSFLMEAEKIFLNPDINLTSVAKKLQVPTKSLSFVLNNNLKTGFNEYVNNYRIESIKDYFLYNKNHNKTISEIAYENGFNSISTFQRAFKTNTGMSPKEFLKQNP